MPDADGIDLSPALAGAALPRRELYAESFAPLMEFGWAPLRAIRSGPWKFIAAPKPELFDIDHDASEQTNVANSQPTVARELDARANRYSPPRLPATPAHRRQRTGALARPGLCHGFETRSRARGRRSEGSPRRRGPNRPGDLGGTVRPGAQDGAGGDSRRRRGNGQAHVRLGFVLAQSVTASGRNGSSRRRSTADCRPRTHISVWPPAWGGATTWPAPSGAQRGQEARTGQSGRDREPRDPPGRPGQPS